MRTKIDKYAEELYGEFGFSTCTEEQQDKIIQLILDEVTVKYMRRIYGDSDIIQSQIKNETVKII